MILAVNVTRDIPALTHSRPALCSAFWCVFSVSRAPRPADAAEPPIINTFFWPDVDPKNLRDTLRYEGTVTAARRRLAIKTAMSEVNAELYDYRDARCWPVLKRWPRYPAEAIDGVSIKLTHYFAAVSSLTAATIVERYRG